MDDLIREATERAKESGALDRQRERKEQEQAEKVAAAQRVIERMRAKAEQEKQHVAAPVPTVSPRPKTARPHKKTKKPKPQGMNVEQRVAALSYSVAKKLGWKLVDVEAKDALSRALLEVDLAEVRQAKKNR